MVDGPGAAADGYPSVGDLVITGRYPADLDASTFGDFQDSNFVVTDLKGGTGNAIVAYSNFGTDPSRKWPWNDNRNPLNQYYYEGERCPDDGDLVLKAVEHGTITMANTTWRASGVVTVAEGIFDGWLGRRVHESGSFLVNDAGAPVSGDSIFRLN